MSPANRAPQDFSLTTKGPMVCFLGLWSEEAYHNIKKCTLGKEYNELFSMKRVFNEILSMKR